jgi:hypothetical protein
MLFKKVDSNSSIFQKVAGRGDIFQKVKTILRKADNSVARVGNFLVNTGHQLGLDPLANQLKGVVNNIHNSRVGISNSLEKSVRGNINEIHKDNDANVYSN